MLKSIVGQRLHLYLPNGWEFDPWITGAGFIDYTLTEGPHKGRHAIQKPTYRRLADNVEFLGWYEETGTTVTLVWHLDSQVVDRFATVPRWLADVDMSISAGDNQDPEFREKMAQLAAAGPDMPRHIYADHGHFELSNK
ncbi:phenolic acid decarboxylase [Streptomyces gardneri]|uniref:phenolic acid decarboxylase n=1 Tax=Nocardia TaxID=1817 RepID=UPI00135B6CF3|nr:MULTISPECIES: phenolic acid decarboxylase [Nocardia]MBF6166316.1 phenolic acid decarboxylase [Streptomyces gardneri]MBF6205109.1 phenolic acid decarboxylase [Streptomyces gardneri]UAK30908.1 phenolic acid decarboxylase [Nocardia asteroides]